MDKFIISLILLLSISISYSAEYDLEQLIEHTLNNNPGIQAMHYRIAAFQEKEIMTVKIMDPMLAIEYSNVPLDDLQLDKHAMSGLQLKLQQTIPFYGKNSLRKEIAEIETGSSIYQMEEFKNILKFKVRKAYYSLLKVRELKEISILHIAALQDLVYSLRSKYETGKIKQNDYLRLELLNKKMQDDLYDFDQMVQEITVLLRSTADLDPEATIVAGKPEASFLPAETIEELFNLSLLNRPELAEYQNEIDKRRLEIKLSRRLKIPDITLWTGYRYRQDIAGMPGEDLVSFGFSIPLNFDISKNLKAKYNFSNYMLNKAELDLADKKKALRQDLETALAKWERLDQKTSFYKNTIIPEAESLFELVLRSYETAGSDFSAVYQAQTQLINFEKTYINSKYEKLIIKAQIDMITGY